MKEEKVLREEGVLKRESFLSDNELSLILSEVDTLVHEKDIYNVQPDLANTYESLRESKEYVINRRVPTRDGDDGLIDVWNIDRYFSPESQNILEKIKTHSLNVIERSFETKYKFFTHNLYVNRGVRTRGIHADSDIFPSRVKSFCFLTDVPDETYGPFSYIKGTHLEGGKKYHRRYDIYEPLSGEERDNYEVYTGIEKGDLVIAAVAGAHRGLNQEKDKVRIVLVSSYDPE